MPAGTITLTNNSTAVTGTGTALNTELKANDFLVAVVGGVTYTLGVKSVESATALTLTTAYSGPTTSGLAWTPIPNGTLVGITAQIAADTARAIRGLNYDKQNWQQILSGSGNVTVMLPDGSAYAGPAWNGIATTLTAKADKASLGTAATKNVNAGAWEYPVGNVVTVGNLGFGQFTSDVANPSAVYNGFYRTQIGYRNGICFKWDASEGEGWQFARTTGGAVTGDSHPSWCNIYNGTPSNWFRLYSEANTTIDSGGFIKKASPVVKVFASGKAYTNEESEGVTVTRQAVGEYLIEGCMGLNSDASWSGIDGGFDIPKDRNHQALVWLDYDVNPDGSILVKTYHRTYPDAPAFARNIRDGYENGDPIDIPADQFVSVRVEMPADSIWNQKQAAAQKAMEEAERQLKAEQEANQSDA